MRTAMEQRAGMDLGHVRVHSDDASASASGAIGARAFTYGSDIFLGNGAAQTDVHLMAHELTHVVQQRGRPTAPKRQAAVGPQQDLAETQADAVADGVSRELDEARIVDDAPTRAGQLSRDAFMRELKQLITEAATEELGPFWSAAGCPYIQAFFEKHQTTDAHRLEQIAKRYSGVHNANSAADYYAPILVRVRSAVRRWRHGDDISGDLSAVSMSAMVPIMRDSAATQLEQRSGILQRTPDGAAAPRRFADDDRAQGPGEAAAVLDRLGPGVQLDPSAASHFAPSTVGLASGVRLHTDGHTAAIAASIGARAFSVGPHIGFGSGEYRPGTPGGDALLAHELAHSNQPASLGHASAEREANRAAAAAAMGDAAPPQHTGGRKGLALRRCGVETSFDPSDVDVGFPTGPDAVTRAVTSALSDDDAKKALFFLQGDAASGVEVALRLRQMPDTRHGNKFLALQYLLTELPAAEYWESQRLLGADPLQGDQALRLTAAGRKLFDDLFAIATLDTGAPAAIEAALKGVREASSSDLMQVVLALTRTYSPRYGNRMHSIQAVVKEKGSDAQYRELIRLIHAPGVAAGLDEADPALAALVEAQAASIKQGSTVSADEVLALFGTRAREVALTMLRESEGQIVRVLSRTEGGGAPAVQIQSETEKIIAALNDIRKKYLRDKDNKPLSPVAIFPFEQVRPGLETRARNFGTDVGEEALRREYDRQVQITLHLIAAPMDMKFREEIARLQKEIDEADKFLRGPHIVPGQNPLELAGPVAARRRVEAENERIRQADLKIRRLTPQRDEVKKAQQQVEGALPLLGGLTDSGLAELSKIRGAAEFDKIRDAALARILGNVEKVRADLISGELNIWMIEKVVARTKLLFGVEDPPGNEAQKAWAAVVDARVAKEKKDARKVGDFLEILNVAALIVALGAALFTGGGSLALYAGIAGTGLGLGTAIYNVIDTQGRLSQAEELYGSGLTYETRLSDVPPDWRFLYYAWLNLGINALLAIFMIKGLGKAASSGLRGEAAAVEKEVRALAKRLRDRGVVAMTEDEIVNATMAALRDEGMVVGALRGTSVYRVGPKLTLVGGPGKSLEKAIDAEVLSAPRLRGATLAKDATAAAAADEVGYLLTVPTKSGGTEVVKVSMRTRPTSSLAPGPHGAESGPARLLVSRDATGWKATIEFDQGLNPGDLRFGGGHELDELADLVHRRPTARPGDIARETQAVYFRPGGATRTATGRAVLVPAHDAATAQELKNLMDELERLRGMAGTKAGQLLREKQIDALMKEMGLDTPAMLRDRVAALRKAGIDEALIKKLEARAAIGELQAAAPLSPAGASARAVTQMDGGFVHHMIKAEGRTGGAFVKQGISGCHVTAELEAFESANARWAFELEKTKEAGGTIFRRYKQWLWKDASTPPPTSRALRPGGSKFNPADWTLSTSPKTTADSLQALLREAEDAWGAWRSNNPILARTEREFGRGLAGTNPPATSSSKVEFSGFFDYYAGTSSAGEQWRLITGFVDASWF
jgi:hypothetical protein